MHFILTLALACSLLLTSSVQVFAFSEITLQKRLDSFVNAKHAPGVAVALSVPWRKDVIVRVGGLASLELNVPMRGDMVFRFGSLAKIVTAMRIKEQISKGKLSLDADMRTLFPVLATLKSPINVEHLLTHSSGFPAFFEIKELFDNMNKAWTSVELMQLLGSVEQSFVPGSVQRYGNVGYYLLGLLLLERGQFFESFMSRSLQKSLNISLVSDAEVVLNKVSGYSKNLRNEVVLPPFMSSALFLGTGDLQGTVEDVLHLLSLWKNYDLVPAAFLANGGKKLHEHPTVGTFLTGKWGFFEGMELFLLQDKRVLLGKSGIYPGYASYYFYDPKSSVSMVIACNQDTAGFALWRLALDIFTLSTEQVQ